MCQFIKNLYKKLFNKAENSTCSILIEILHNKEINIKCVVPEDKELEYLENSKDFGRLLFKLDKGIITSEIIKLLEKNPTKFNESSIVFYNSLIKEYKAQISEYINNQDNEPLVRPSRVFNHIFQSLNK